MEIATDVHKIIGEGNCYLVLNPIPCVIDTGNASQSAEIKAEIEKHIPVEEIKLVLLTHLHYDHSENVEMFPNAEVYASAEEIDDFAENPENFFFYGFSPTAIESLQKKLKPLPSEINDLEVVKVPGHTRGSVVFLDEKRNLLFSGDTLFNNGIGRTDFPNSVPTKMWESVEKITGLINSKGLKLCPGHDY